MSACPLVPARRSRPTCAPRAAGSESRAVTRVPAAVLARDREADLAILRLPSGRCASCPHLTLATAKAGEGLVVTGERVLAIGFPLNQEMTLTTGIVSGVRDGAIISDVNINHGNSGGPMMNSRRTYPLAALNEAVEKINDEHYRRQFERDADHFKVDITTPVVYRVELRQFEKEVGEERKKLAAIFLPEIDRSAEAKPRELAVSFQPSVKRPAREPAHTELLQTRTEHN